MLPKAISMFTSRGKKKNRDPNYDPSPEGKIWKQVIQINNLSIHSPYPN